MPIPRIMLTATAVKGKLYALGGVPAGFTSAEATVQRYDLSNPGLKCYLS